MSSASTNETGRLNCWLPSRIKFRPFSLPEREISKNIQEKHLGEYMDLKEFPIKNSFGLGI